MLRQLSLWDKRDAPTRELSGGMKRRVLIAKALSHQPRVLFLDEPTAGVDVELRKSMWEVVDELRAAGTTIILTTHYIEEAEAIADRVAVINGGHILLVEDKAQADAAHGPEAADDRAAGAGRGHPRRARPLRTSTLSDDGRSLTYAYDRAAEPHRHRLAAARPRRRRASTLRDLQTQQKSLEDIFVDLVRA